MGWTQFRAAQRAAGRWTAGMGVDMTNRSQKATADQTQAASSMHWFHRLTQRRVVGLAVVAVFLIIVGSAMWNAYAHGLYPLPTKGEPLSATATKALDDFPQYFHVAVYQARFVPWSDNWAECVVQGIRFSIFFIFGAAPWAKLFMAMVFGFICLLYFADNEAPRWSPQHREGWIRSRPVKK